MTDTIYELQVGFHNNKLIPYQRIICDTDFTNPYYEINLNGRVGYSKIPPTHWVSEVEVACRHIDLIMEVAKMNYNAGKMIATISSDNTINVGEDIDIWKDIKVWNNGEYPKIQSDKLYYDKHSYHNKYLKSGINKIEMVTDSIYYNGHVLHFIIESSTFQDRYTVNIMGVDRLKRELTNYIHGDYHGYRYFNSFQDVQNWFKESYGVRLIKKGNGLSHSSLS